MNDITPSEFGRGKKLATGAIAAPIVLTVVPASISLVLLLLSVGGPPVAAVILFVGIIVSLLGFVAGCVVSGILLQKRSKWTHQMRERIASNGIRAEEIGWFRGELKANEKRALKAVEARDLLLADAYRETLASRLTATRIVKTSKRELQLTKKRQNSLKQLKSTRAEIFQTEIAKDLENIEKIFEEAKQLQAEAESRLQMIEAAVSRQGGLADSELALKKLTARTADLPLALEAAKVSEEIRRELELEELELDKDLKMR